MAFFKFRKSGDEQSATNFQPESIEAMRKRAKYRLLGAAVLVLLGVIVFPLVFDTQPRPISVDIPIDIPDRTKAKPLAIADPSIKPKLEPAGSSGVVPGASDPVLPVAVEEQKPVAAVTEKAPDKPVEKPLEKAAEKPTALKVQADDGVKAQALLDGKEVAKNATSAEGRFVVQVGAFAEVTRAREVRQSVEHAGLKTYTQVVESKDGRRIRVRIGPFTDKAEAEKAAEKVKSLGLPAALLTL
jgi:DedD protein